MNLIGVEDPLAVNRDLRAVGRTCAAGQQDVLSAKQSRPVVAPDFDGMRVHEARVAFQGRHVIPAQLGLDDLNLSRHHCLSPKDQIRPGNAVFEHVSTPIERALPKTAEVKHGFPKGLAGDGPGVDANAADRMLAINDRDFLAQLGGANGRREGACGTSIASRLHRAGSL
jgi:hypothetical protein